MIGLTAQDDEVVVRDDPTSAPRVPELLDIEEVEEVHQAEEAQEADHLHAGDVHVSRTPLGCARRSR